MLIIIPTCMYTSQLTQLAIIVHFHCSACMHTHAYLFFHFKLHSLAVQVLHHPHSHHCCFGTPLCSSCWQVPHTAADTFHSDHSWSASSIHYILPNAEHIACMCLQLHLYINQYIHTFLELYFHSYITVITLSVVLSARDR